MDVFGNFPRQRFLSRAGVWEGEKTAEVTSRDATQLESERLNRICIRALARWIVYYSREEDANGINDFPMIRVNWRAG